MKLEQDFYGIEYQGTLKNGFKITTTFKVDFNKQVGLDSEEYKTTEREIRDIVSLIWDK